MTIVTRGVYYNTLVVAGNQLLNTNAMKIPVRARSKRVICKRTTLACYCGRPFEFAARRPFEFAAKRADGYMVSYCELLACPWLPMMVRAPVTLEAVRRFEERCEEH